MVHFKPEGFLPLGKAFEEVCLKLENCDELARRIDELDNRTGELDRRITDLIADGTTTGEERQAALQAANDELQAANDKLQAGTDEFYAAKLRGEDRVRMAVLTGQLSPWSLNPISGQMEPILVDPEEWGRLAFGFPAVDTYSDPFFSPGPDTEGRPMFFKQSEFQEWLDAQQRETGAPGETEERTKRRVGHPDEYDWDEGFQFMCRELDRRGDPLLPENAVAGWRSEADVVRAVIAHITLPGEKPGDPPREPEFRNARRRVASELEKWRSEQRQASTSARTTMA
jgi:hypothetical protein